MRECHRVLKPGGMVAGYLIHTTPGLSDADETRADELGPSLVSGASDPRVLIAEAGLSLTLCEDVTTDFRETSEALGAARGLHEADLRAEEGDEVYEEERQKQRDMRRGIDDGLLMRSLIVAVKD